MIYHSVERIRLQHVEQIPVNRVRALQLQADLQAEYGKGSMEASGSPCMGTVEV